MRRLLGVFVMLATAAFAALNAGREVEAPDATGGMVLDAREYFAPYVEPTTYEVKMNETFTTRVADGRNKAGAFFFAGD